MRLLHRFFILLLATFCLTHFAWADVYVHTPPVNIGWYPNPEPDVSGYELFKSTSYDGTYVKIQTGTINTTSWQDYDVQEGSEYYYKLRAVDIFGNASTLSAASDGVIIDSTPPTVLPSAFGGTYYESMQVALTASEPSTIYYTTDGTVPTTASPVYSAPIMISQSLTLRFFAVDLAGNQGAVRTESYVIDTGVDQISLAGPSGMPNPVASGGQVSCRIDATDSFGHVLNFQWTATGGEFSDASAADPTWTAPENWSNASQFHEITVVVTCSEGITAGGSFFEEVLPGGNVAPVADAGGDQFVSGGVRVVLDGGASYDPDGGPSAVTFQWRQIAGGMVSLDGANSRLASFVSPATDDVLEFELAVSDGSTVATDSVGVTVDTQPPALSRASLAPYPQQGLDGRPGAPAVTCFRAKLSDVVGLKLAQQDIQHVITACALYTVSGKETAEPIPGTVTAIEAEPGAAWFQFVPDYAGTYGSGLPLGLKIGVTIQASDKAGNVLSFSYRFTVNSSPPDVPGQKYSADPDPGESGDILSVTLLDGQMAGSWMEFLDTVPVLPYYVYAGQPSKLRGTNCLALRMQPAIVFQDPAKIFVPIKGTNNLRKYKIYHYDPNPAVGWSEAQAGDGWLIYREDHMEYDPPTIELWVSHF